MRSFKDVADRHVVSLDNKQLALFTSGAVVAAGLFFLTGVLYGTRVSLPSGGSLGSVSTLGSSSSGTGSMALRLNEDASEEAASPAGSAKDTGAKEMAGVTAATGSTVVPVGKGASDAERKKLLEQYSRESVGSTVTETPVGATAATPATGAKPAATSAAASQPSRPMAQIPPPASSGIKSGGVITVKPADAKPAAPAAAAATSKAPVKVAVAETSKASDQPLLRGRTLSSMKGHLTVQVASYTDKGTAKKELDRWTKQHFPAFLGAETVKGKKLYRIQLGRFSDKKQAEKARDVLVKDLHLKGPKVADAVK